MCFFLSSAIFQAPYITLGTKKHWGALVFLSSAILQPLNITLNKKPQEVF